MKIKSNHNVRVTFRVSQEEYRMYLKLARSKGFKSISAVIRDILRCRVSVLRRLLRERDIDPQSIGDEIQQMFSNYEERGREREYPSDLNRRL